LTGFKCFVEAYNTTKSLDFFIRTVGDMTFYKTITKLCSGMCYTIIFKVSEWISTQQGPQWSWSYGILMYSYLCNSAYHYYCCKFKNLLINHREVYTIQLHVIEFYRNNLVFSGYADFLQQTFDNHDIHTRVSLRVSACGAGTAYPCVAHEFTHGF
jgi:uncharacterized protein YhbP (UPF0306 family)